MIDEAEILGGEGEGAPQLGALHLQPVRVNVHQHLPQAALRLEEGVRRPDNVAVDAGLGQDIWGVSVCSHQLDDNSFWFLMKFKISVRTKVQVISEFKNNEEELRDPATKKVLFFLSLWQCSESGFDPISIRSGDPDPDSGEQK
jgi:hypothetical protein